jgi:hypothetical protein
MHVVQIANQCQKAWATPRYPASSLLGTPFPARLTKYSVDRFMVHGIGLANGRRGSFDGAEKNIAECVWVDSVAACRL